MASLAEIRAKLKQQETTKQTRSTSGGNDALYPVWNIPEGKTATLRFLPDADPKNDWFWVTKEMVKLEFNGVVGGDLNQKVVVQVPCMEMYEGEAFNSCPIHAEIRPWFKSGDKNLEELARKYWKKKSYLMYGFVRDNPIDGDNAPENPIRRFSISKQIWNIIENSCKNDPDIEVMPSDVTQGLDFRVTKTQKGGYSDYGTSSFARKESALTEVEQAAIAEHGLTELKSLLPKKPGEVELKVIKEMFEASLDGKPYDPQRWGQYYKPYGLQVEVSESSTPTQTTSSYTPPPAAATTDIPFEPDEPVTASAPVQTPSASTASTSTQDILAMIKARQNKQ